MMFDCRKGECGLCLVDIQHIDGVIDHRDVFLSERQHRGTKLCTCVSRAVSHSAAQARGITPASTEADPAAVTHGLTRPVLTIDIP